MIMRLHKDDTLLPLERPPFVTIFEKRRATDATAKASAFSRAPLFSSRDPASSLDRSFPSARTEPALLSLHDLAADPTEVLQLGGGG